MAPEAPETLRGDGEALPGAVPKIRSREDVPWVKLPLWAKFRPGGSTRLGGVREQTNRHTLNFIYIDYAEIFL